MTTHDDLSLRLAATIGWCLEHRDRRRKVRSGPLERLVVSIAIDGQGNRHVWIESLERLGTVPSLADGYELMDAWPETAPGEIHWTTAILGGRSLLVALWPGPNEFDEKGGAL